MAEQYNTCINNILRLGASFVILDNIGKVGIYPLQGYTPFVDVDGEVEGKFDNKGFSLKQKDSKEWMDYVFGVPLPYKEMPVFKAWLVQQNLEM